MWAEELLVKICSCGEEEKEPKHALSPIVPVLKKVNIKNYFQLYTIFEANWKANIALKNSFQSI